MSSTFLRAFSTHASDFIPDALERGFNRSLQALSMTELNARLAAGHGIDTPGTRQAIEKVALYQSRIDSKKADPELQKQIETVLSSKGFGHAVVNLVKSPKAVFNAVAEGLASETPTMIAAACSLAAGPATPAVMVTSTTSVAALNAFGQEMVNQLRRHGVALDKPEALLVALNDHELMTSAQKKSLLRAGIGAAFTLATLGAGRVIAGIANATRAAEYVAEPIVVSSMLRTVGQTVQTLAVHQRMPTVGEIVIAQAAGTVSGRVRSLSVR